MINKYFESVEDLSRAIDKVIEAEKEIKAKIPNHPRYTKMRMQLDAEIKNLRWLKKTALKEWRQIKKDPIIQP